MDFHIPHGLFFSIQGFGVAGAERALQAVGFRRKWRGPGCLDRRNMSFFVFWNPYSYYSDIIIYIYIYSYIIINIHLISHNLYFSWRRKMIVWWCVTSNSRDVFLHQLRVLGLTETTSAELLGKITQVFFFHLQSLENHPFSSRSFPAKDTEKNSSGIFHCYVWPAEGIFQSFSHEISYPNCIPINHQYIGEYNPIIPYLVVHPTY